MALHWAAPAFAGIAGVAIFGDPGGCKIAALAIIPLLALTMFVFMRRLSGNAWTAMAAAMLYTVGAQLLSRLADFQHTASIYAYIFPPLILLAFLKVTEERSWRATAWLGLAWSEITLSFMKPTLVFFTWLWVKRPSARTALLRGTGLALMPLAEINTLIDSMRRGDVVHEIVFPYS